MRVFRKIASAVINLICERAPFALCATFITAVAFAAIPATTASAAVTSPAAVSATTAFPATASWTSCPNNDPPNGGYYFWRCNGSAWVGIFGLPAPQNYNAATYFTVIYYWNSTDVRVWLHQYASPNETEGWNYCISPLSDDVTITPLQPIPIEYENPEDIQITTNSNHC
jgi:hypothetical protein